MRHSPLLALVFVAKIVYTKKGGMSYFCAIWGIFSFIVFTWFARPPVILNRCLYFDTLFTYICVHDFLQLFWEVRNVSVTMWVSGNISSYNSIIEGD